jgi:hypothetical protein
MKVHIRIPYCINKNLGKAYNEAMADIPANDWACFIDYDAMLLTPDAGRIIHEYASLSTPVDNPPVFTCYTNRISVYSKEQLLAGQIMNSLNIKDHITIAEYQKNQLYKSTEIIGPASGFLMMISKKTWDETKFDESKKCLGVDSDFIQKIRDKKNKLLRMDGLYIFHNYRIMNGVNDKKHLL